MVLDRRHVRTEKPRPTVLIVSSHGSYLAPTINHKYRLKYKIKVKKIIYIYILVEISFRIRNDFLNGEYSV